MKEPFNWIRLGSLAVLLAVPLAARAGSVENVIDPETGERTTVIHVSVHDWIFPDPARTDAFTRSETAAVRAFMRRFPEIFAERYRARYAANPERYGEFDWDRVEVRLRQFSGIQVEGVESDLLAIAGRVAPDVIYMNFRKSDTYIKQGFLYPLDRPEDDYLSSLTDEELASRVHPKIWPVIRRKGAAGETHVWSLPYGGVLGKILLYRRDLFDEAGVPYPSSDWTWDDMYEACRRLTRPADGVYGIRFGRGKQESYHWVSYLWSTGADILAYDESTDQWSVVFDTPAAARALDFYTRLCTEPWTDADGRQRYGYAHKDAGDALVKWRRGEIGMAESYIDEQFFSSINPDVTGMAPVPIGPTGLRGGELNSRMMGLFAGIEEPTVRDAAWEFIRFHDSDEAVEIKTRIMVEGGLGRFVNPRYLRQFGYEELIRLAPKGWEETFDIVMETGRPEPYGQHSNIAYEILTEPIQKAEQLALAGKLPEDEAERLAVMHDLLKQAANKARRVMLGELPQGEQQKRRGAAALFLVAVVAAFAVAIRKIIRTFTPPEAVGQRRLAWNLRRYLWAYVMLVPAVLTILVWQYVPLFRGSLMAFQDYRIMGGSSFVWLDNFGGVLFDPDWWRAVWNALRYSFLVIALTFLPPVILAILLQEIPRFGIFFRTVYYLPAVISGLVVILLWKSFYGDSERGALNAVLMQIPAVAFVALGAGLLWIGVAFGRRLFYHDIRGLGILCLLAGLVLCETCVVMAWPMLIQTDVPVWKRLLMTIPEPYRWLQDPRTAMLACVIPIGWAALGPGCLIYLAALKGIADDFYEAADIDGASFIDKILFIVFPILKPLLIINFVGVFIAAWFTSEATILAMTGGAAETEVAGLKIFYDAFIYLRFGPATAMAWILGFMLIGFTMYQLRILSRLEFRTTGEK